MPTQDHGKRCETTIDEPVAILKHHAEGFSYRQIAEIIDISKSQAQTIITNYQASGTVRPQERTGAHSKLNDRDQ